MQREEQEAASRPPKMNRAPKVISSATLSAADAVLTEAIAPEEPALSDLEARMAEMDRKIDVINHYRIILNDRIFESESDAAILVENEIKSFVQNQIEVFLGHRPGGQGIVGTPTVTSSPLFSSEEVHLLRDLAAIPAEHIPALKAFVASVYKKSQGHAAAPEGPKTPQAPAPPQIKRVQADIAAAPAVKPASAPAPAPTPQRVQRPLRRIGAPTSLSSGRLGGNRPPADPVIKRRYVEVETVDGTGTRKMDVTGQVRPAAGDGTPQPMPMPQGEAMTMATAQLASNQIQHMGAAIGAVASAVGAKPGIG